MKDIVEMTCIQRTNLITKMDFVIVLTHVSSLKSGRSLYSEQNG